MVNATTSMTREEIQAREEFAERAMYQHCEAHSLDVPNHIIKDALRIGFDAGVERAKHKWIPVNEQVPEFWKDDKYDDTWHEQTKRSYFSDVVLVYAQHAQLGRWGIFCAEYIKKYNWVEAKWGPADFVGVSNPICNTTHWMSLPEAPK